MGDNHGHGHGHGQERIACNTSGDELYDEHIDEITEYCVPVVDGSVSDCPYKCSQPMEVLAFHYDECNLRAKHQVFTDVESSGKCSAHDHGHGHGHGQERIACNTSGDALYDEHIDEITECCVPVLNGSVSDCPYK